MYKKRAKRANRPNPRTDRKSKVIDFPKSNRKADIVMEARSLNQEIFIENLQDDMKSICFGVGPAGSGKTYIATLAALAELKNNNIDKIIIARPNVAVDDRDIGFLPGDILEKMKPWVKPILDIIEEYYSPKEILKMLEEGILEICPVAYLRGRTFKDAWILIDEAQGMSPNAMKSALTRIGENSKMVITGDIEQSDIAGTNGLADFLNRFTQSNRISINRFEKLDVVRHPVVKEVLDLYP